MTAKLILVATLFTASAAFANEPLGTEALSVLVTGNTLFVQVPPGAPGAPEGGIAPIYYGKDGSAVAQLPAGPKLVGVWSMGDKSYCIDWENGPKNSCTTIARREDAFLILDKKTGDPRGIVSRIETGNPENL